ncbi:MAG: hypothetical protein KGI71_04870, partial [Patescibacteria group bacterium]|nr:hypothetical protein [Patescibacteria group bacterium]
MAGKTVTVAYEQAHECREGCACESPYIDRVRAALADLGSADPEGDIAKSSRYVRGARKAGLEPNQAAAMILAMSRQDPASYVPRHRFEDFAGESGDDYLTTQRKAYDYWMSVGNQPGMLQSMTPDEHLQSAVRAETEAARDDQEAMRLEAAGSTRSAHVARLNAAKYRGFALAHRELMGRKRLMPVGASETAAHDYEAVDSRGRRVFGPTKDYQEAKLHASRAGGVVRFTMGASEARDGKLEDKEAIADHLRAEGHGDDYIRTAIGDEAFAAWQKARGGASDCVGIHTHAPVLAQERVSYHDRQKLPATAFALRRRRALLLTDKHGKVTAGHVKAAAARLSMMQREGHVTRAEREEAHAAIVRAGKKVGIDVSEAGECPAWYAAMEDERPELSPFDGKMHWHRSDGGDYYADAGPHGRVWVRQREQDKRRGVLRWFATVQKVEVAQGEV